MPEEQTVFRVTLAEDMQHCVIRSSVDGVTLTLTFNREETTKLTTLFLHMLPLMRDGGTQRAAVGELDAKGPRDV